MFRRRSPFGSLLLSTSSFYTNNPSSTTSYPNSETSQAPGVKSPFTYRPENYYNTSNPYKPVAESISQDAAHNTVKPKPKTHRLPQAVQEANLKKANGDKKKPTETMMNEDNIPLASTILCVSPDFKLLFIKRSRQMKFMPNLYAFPGGKVDSNDLDLAMNDKGVTRAMNKKNGLNRIKERVAAVRELHEELAVYLNGNGDVLMSDPEKRQTQDLTCISSLVPFQRWITPKEESRRFDTYFFLLKLQKDVTTVPLIMNEGEIADARWLTPQEAYDLHHKPDSGFRLPPPTQVIVHMLRKNYKDPSHLISHYSSMFAPLSGRGPLPIEPKITIDKNGDFVMGLRERETAEEFVEDPKKGIGKKKILIGDFGYEIPAGFMKNTGGNVRNPAPKMYVTV